MSKIEGYIRKLRETFTRQKIFDRLDVIDVITIRPTRVSGLKPKSRDQKLEETRD